MHFNIEYVTIIAIILVNLAAIFFVRSLITKYFITFFLVILSILFFSQIIFDIELLLKIAILHLILAILANMAFHKFISPTNLPPLSRIYKICVALALSLLFCLTSLVFLAHSNSALEHDSTKVTMTNKIVDNNIEINNLAHNRQHKIAKIKANKLNKIIFADFTLIILFLALIPLILVTNFRI